MNPSSPTRVRYLVVLATALVAVLLYLDRFCISLAEVYIKEDLGLSDTQIGWVLSAFFWSYALAQVPSGWLTDRFGARKMLAIYVLCWSLLTGLTGLAFGFVVLIALRLGFGVGQAGAYPSSASLISKWVPFSGRGTASTVVAVGGRLGGFLAPILTALLIVAFVPVSVSSRLEPADLLDSPRLSFEMLHGTPAGKSPFLPEPESVAARFGRRIADRLPSGPAIVESMSNEYAAEWEQQRGEAISKMHKPSPALKLPPPSGETLRTLAADLNAALADRDLYDEQVFANVELPREAHRLLAGDRAALGDAEVLRLNRLLLEAVYPDSVSKVYVAGWRPVMIVFGLAGLVVAGLFWWVVRDAPSGHPRCSAEELALIEHGRPASATSPHGRVGGVPLGDLVRNVSMWLMCASQWFTNVGWVFLVTWAPRYLVEVHDVPIELRGWMVGIPIAVGWLGMLSGGRATDWLVRRLGLRWGRGIPMTLSRFTAAAAYFACLREPSAWVAVALFSVVAFSTDFGTGAIWAYMQDVGGRNVGSVLGWGNMWGNFGAAVTPPLLIWMVGESRNWTLALLVCGLAFVVSGIAALGIDATNPISREETEQEGVGQ